MNKKLLKSYLWFIAGIVVSYSVFFIIDNVIDKQVDDKAQESIEATFKKTASNKTEENILLNRETPPNPELESY